MLPRTCPNNGRVLQIQLLRQERQYGTDLMGHDLQLEEVLLRCVKGIKIS